MNISDYILKEPVTIKKHLELIRSKGIVLSSARSSHLKKANKSRHQEKVRFIIEQVFNEKISLKLMPNTGQGDVASNKNYFALRADYHGVKIFFWARLIESNHKIEIQLPKKMLWLQRRNYYRTHIPESHKQTNCELHISIESLINQVILVTGEFSIIEMSPNGLSFISHDQSFNEAVLHDAKINICHVSVNSVTKYLIKATIRNISELDGGALRIGLEFINIPVQLDSIIQSYTQEIQLTKIADKGH